MDSRLIDDARLRPAVNGELVNRVEKLRLGNQIGNTTNRSGGAA